MSALTVERYLASMPTDKRQLLDTLLLSYPVFKKTYINDPVAFLWDCVDWEDGKGPVGYQEELIGDFLRYPRMAVRGPHGLGKSAVGAWSVLHSALCWDGDFGWKYLTTASAWRQLTHFLWPEISFWARRLRWNKIRRAPFIPDRELLNLSLRLETGEAFALASNAPTSLEGAHAQKLRVLFDEAKTIGGETFDALEGALSTGEASVAALSTPGATSGRFYSIFKERDKFREWRVRFVTADEVIKAGRMSEEWLEGRRREWGENSPVFLNRALGEFAADDPLSLVPFSWVEASNRAWTAWQESGQSPGRPISLGVDVGGGNEGADKSVIAIAYAGPNGCTVEILEKQATGSGGEALMELSARVAGHIEHFHVPAYIDAIGIGAGVVARLREMGRDARPFIASKKTLLTDSTGDFHFLNWRSAMWHLTKEALAPDRGVPLLLPPDEELIGELTAPHSTLLSAGVFQVEAKDQVIKRLGRSTDTADAILMAVQGPVLWAEVANEGLTELIYRPRKAGERWA